MKPVPTILIAIAAFGLGAALMHKPPTAPQYDNRLLYPGLVVLLFVFLMVLADLNAPGDTARYIVRWTAPTVGPNQFPIANYLIRLVHANADTFVFHSQPASQLVDTLATPRPLTLTDSIGPMTVTVTAVDTRSVKGPPAQTSSWWIKRKAIPPSAPGLPTVDSSLALIRVDIRPAVVALTVGASVPLCAFGTLEDGTKGIMQWGKITATDSFRIDTTAYCQAKFQLFLTERPA